MALENLISIEVTAQEVTDLTQALTVIENFMKAKLISLTPEQRKEYGRVGDGRINWLNKTNDFMVANPDTVPTFIDVAENTKDRLASQALNPLLSKITTLNTAFEDTLIVMLNDMYYNGLTYYKNIQILANNNVPGAGAIYDELKKEFEKSKTTPKQADTTLK
jgi:hypothetical protein